MFLKTDYILTAKKTVATEQQVCILYNNCFTVVMKTQCFILKVRAMYKK